MLKRFSQLFGKDASIEESQKQSSNDSIMLSNDEDNSNYSPAFRKSHSKKTLDASTMLNLFEMLPCETMLLIFSFLNVKALGKATRVCGYFHSIAEFPELWRALLESKHNRTALIIYAKLKQDKNDKNNNNKLKPKKADGSAAGVRASVAAPVSGHHNAYVQGDTTLPEDNFSGYIDKVIENKHIEGDENYVEYDDWNFKEMLKLSKDYPSIAEALRHAPADSRCRILVRPGVYSETLRVEQPIEIIGVGDDPSKVIVESAAPSTLPLLTVDVVKGKHAATSKAVIRNLTLVQKPSQTGDPVFCVMLKCGNILMERNVITSDSCTSVCVQHQRGRVNVRGNKITGSSAGVSVFACRSDFTIENNDIYGTHYSGIELRQGTNPIVIRNKIHDTKSAGVLVFNGAKGLLVDNDIYKNVLSGVDISREGNPVVRQNKIRNSVGHGLYIYGGGRGVIEGNEIFNNGKCNICIDKGGDPYIKGNKIHGALMGLSVIGEAKGLIEENDIYNHEGEGIGVLDKANPMVRRNKIFLNKRNGIIVYHEGFGTFEENEIYNNLGAFHLQRNTEAILKDNIIHDNESIGDEITECVEKGTCTFSVTGSSFRYQAWYYCDTCETEKDLGCCESCAKSCHAGHKLSERKFSLFFCDCSSEWGCRICPSKKH